MLRLEQWLAGRDFARGDAQAAGMVNFCYFAGDDATHEAVLVDPAWDIDGLLARVAREGYTLVGALASHYHPDHIGGEMLGWSVEGIARLQTLIGPFTTILLGGLIIAILYSIFLPLYDVISKIKF